MDDYVTRITKARRNEHQKDRYANDAEFREKCKKNASKWRKENPEKAKEYRRNYYLKHREKCIADVRAWQEAHPERAKEINNLATKRRRERLRLTNSHPVTGVNTEA